MSTERKLAMMGWALCFKLRTRAVFGRVRARRCLRLQHFSAQSTRIACAHDAGHHAIYLDFTFKKLPRRAYHYKLHKTSPSPAKIWPSFRSVWRFNDALSWRCHVSTA